MSLTHVAVIGLAVWRLSSLLVREDGPWQMLVRLRLVAGVRLDDTGRLYGENELAELLTCVWCLSVWIGTVATVAYLLFPAPTMWISLPLAFSSIAVVADEYAGGTGGN